MRALGLLFVAFAGCQTVAAPAAPAPQASIGFHEVPDNALQWSFETRNLPGVDPSGAIVIGHVSHGNISTSLGMTLRWLEVGKPPRSFAVLEERELSDAVYDVGTPEASTALAATVRTRLAEANRKLAAMELRPLVACKVREATPPRVTCGSMETELDEAALGWSIAPVEIADAPRKMVTHVFEAYWDPQTRQLAALVDHRCVEMLGDACFLPEEWRVARLD